MPEIFVSRPGSDLRVGDVGREGFVSLGQYHAVAGQAAASVEEIGMGVER